GGQLGAWVSVCRGGGRCGAHVRSTIVDLTGTVPRMLRAGVVTIDQLRKVVPMIDLPAPPPEAGDGLPGCPGMAESQGPKPAEPHPLAGAGARPGSGPGAPLRGYPYILIISAGGAPR